ncbi:Exocyst complex subunit Exo70, C-terminal [Dillenia turbinata]|uniref:Exocyst complex subunit Exo70, C-terminal n=1 Tax=Dillenia turbinata TaxID=194707 RepID=A0AAN8V3Z2_9MAGN
MATINEHSEILNVLFKDEGWLELNPVPEEEQTLGSSCTFWPIDCYLYSVACGLESKLKHLFGDERICKHVKKVQWHATTYKRITLGSVLSSVCTDDAEQLSANTYFAWPTGSYPMTKQCESRRLLKAKLSAFNVAFERTYKRQTG